MQTKYIYVSIWCKFLPLFTFRSHKFCYFVTHNQPSIYTLWDDVSIFTINSNLVFSLYIDLFMIAYIIVNIRKIFNKNGDSTFGIFERKENEKLRF